MTSARYFARALTRGSRAPHGGEDTNLPIRVERPLKNGVRLQTPGRCQHKNNIHRRGAAAANTTDRGRGPFRTRTDACG